MGYHKYAPFTSKVPHCHVKILIGKLHLEEHPEGDNSTLHELPLIASTCNEGWGCIKSLHLISDEQLPLPNRLELRYITISDGRCYAIDTPLNAELSEKLWNEQQKKYPKDPFKDYIVGTGPFGYVAIWLHGSTCSKLLHSFRADEVELTELEKDFYGWMSSTGSLQFTSEEEMAELTQQYSYRYIVLEEYWDEEYQTWIEYDDDDPYYDDLDIESVEDRCSDGTFNYVRGNEELLKKHISGTPQRITVRWHVGREDYMAHFWLREGFFLALFGNFAKEFPDTCAEVHLRLDTRAQQYGIAFRCEGIPVDMPIPEFAYQLIVFKDGIEHYKSPNYKLEKGQWSWLWRKKEKAPETAQNGNGQQ